MLKKKISRWISSFDQISPSAYENLHFQGDELQKNLANGTVSIWIRIYLIYLVVKYGSQMVYRKDPSIQTVSDILERNLPPL